MNLNSEYDVIVLGAGMVGLVTANLCALQNLRVAIVDPQLPATWQKDKYDLRCSAISKRSENILKTIGVWNKITDHRASPYSRMEVWDALSTGEIQFDAAEVREANLGYIVENSLIIQCLWEKLLELAAQDNKHVSRFVPNSPIRFMSDTDQVVLHLADGKVLTAKLLIGADGGNSWLRSSAGIKTKGWDYKQHALVATVETEKAHDATARQCFLKDGILAFLPLTDPQLSTIVWSTTKEKADALSSVNDADFCEELAYAFDYRLGKIIRIEERRAFPLMMQHAERYIANRIALVGDAAHVIHPLAGQGVNLGFYDAEVLTEVLKKAMQARHDIGQTLLLRRYERARKGHTIGMIAGMEFFKQAFGGKTSLLEGLRGLGINMVNSSKFLKKKLMQQAMGL